MYIVTNIDIKELPDNDYKYNPYYEICHINGNEVGDLNGTMSFSIDKELIELQRFGHDIYEENGERKVEKIRFIIGWSKQVEEAIGIPLNVINDLKNIIDDLGSKNYRLKKQNKLLNDLNNYYNNLTLFQKIKLLFKVK